MRMFEFVSKFLRRLFFYVVHFGLVIFPGPLQDMFDFRQGNYREEFGEQEVAGEKQAKSPHVKTDFPSGRSIIGTPATRYIVPVNGRDDDHETFKPHTDIDDDGHKEGDGQVSPEFAEPENLRRQYVTSHHDIVTPAVRAEQVDPVLHEGPAFKFILPVPGHEQFGQVSASDDGPGQHNDLVHDVDVFDGNIFFQFQDLPGNYQQGLHHGEPGEYGSGDKVRRENRRVPARDYGGGKVKGNDRVNRKNERCA